MKWKPWEVLNFILSICLLLHVLFEVAYLFCFSLLLPAFMIFLLVGGKVAFGLFFFFLLLFLKFYSDLDKWIWLPFPPFICRTFVSFSSVRTTLDTLLTRERDKQWLVKRFKTFPASYFVRPLNTECCF